MTRKLIGEYSMWRENVRNIFLSTKFFEYVTERPCREPATHGKTSHPAEKQFVDIQASGSYIGV